MFSLVCGTPLTTSLTQKQKEYVEGRVAERSTELRQKVTCEHVAWYGDDDYDISLVNIMVGGKVEDKMVKFYTRAIKHWFKRKDVINTEMSAYALNYFQNVYRLRFYPLRDRS